MVQRMARVALDASFSTVTGTWLVPIVLLHQSVPRGSRLLDRSEKKMIVAIVIGVIGKIISIGRALAVDRTSHRIGVPDTRPWTWLVALFVLLCTGTYYVAYNILVAIEPMSLFNHVFSFVILYRQYRLSVKKHGYSFIDWKTVNNKIW